jgi:energy-coupling factor transporter ATP-binding protein EcfA2
MPRAPAELPVSVVFGVSLETVRQMQVRVPVVAVLPAPPDYWNNFGNNYSVRTYLLRAGHDPLRLSIKVMIEGGGRTSTRIRELVGDQPWVPAEGLAQPFCSLMANPAAYRDLVADLGFELAVSILRVMGDAMLLSLEEDPADPRQALLLSEAFHLGFLRQEEAYTAYRRGGRYLRYTPPLDVEDAATSFVLVADLVSATNPYEVDFDFTPDELGRNRLAVLIGRNGTGKTQLLLALLDALRTAADEPRFSASRQLPSTIFPIDADPGAAARWGKPLLSRVIVFSSTGSDLYPNAIPPWHDIDYQFFSMTGGGERGANALTTALTDCLRDDHRNTFANPELDPDAFDDRRHGRLELLSRVLRPSGLWRHLHLPVRPGAAEALGQIVSFEGQDYFPIAGNFNEKRQLQRVQFADVARGPVVLDDAMQPRRLSSGETAMLRFAAQAISAVETGSLFLFDEPETHLHPNFVSDFAEILHTLLEATGSIAIAATHSAYLVREAPSLRVRVLTIDDQVVSVDQPRLQTFGASIDSISQAVFQDGRISHQFQETLKSWLAARPEITIDAIIEEVGDEVNRETLSYLRRLVRHRDAPAAEEL